VALDPEITGDLKAEGIVRDLVRGIQNLRKERGLSVTDRIDLFLHSGDPEVQDAVEEFGDYLLSETLGVSVSWGKKPGAQDFECGGKPCAVDLVKAAAD